MRPRRSAIVALFLFLLAPALLLAQSEKRRPAPEQILRNPRLLARYLQLTPEQVTQQQALWKTLTAKLDGVREQEKALAEQLRTALQGSNPNACDVGTLVVGIDALRDQTRAALQEFDEAFTAILTPEQKAKYEALKEAAHFWADQG